MGDDAHGHMRILNHVQVPKHNIHLGTQDEGKLPALVEQHGTEERLGRSGEAGKVEEPLLAHRV